MSEHAPHSPEKVSLPTLEHRGEHVRSREKAGPKESIKEEDARKEVEKALEKELPHASQEAHTETASKSRKQIISPQEKRRAFKKVMTDVQKDMSPSSRAFSKFIHKPLVEGASEVVGNTIARPTSILYGSACAFIVMLGVYLLAKQNGFRLSGFEFIGLFAAGWVIGLIAELFQHMITGRR